MLQPHCESFSRRLVKTPKLYFLDAGLMCTLLGLQSAADLSAHPLRGAAFETFVVAELTKLFSHHGERAPLSFWRDSNGREVDVLMDLGARRLPVEIEAGMTVAADAFAGLEAYERLAAEAAERASSAGPPTPCFRPCSSTVATRATSAAVTPSDRVGLQVASGSRWDPPMAELLGTPTDNIGLHLDEATTAEESSVVQIELGHRVRRSIKHRSLTA